MTKFITYYNICPIHDPKEFLGISADSDEGNVIATLSRNIVIVIKISTQKQIRSWSVVEKLSSKVLYNRRTQKYVGVFSNNALRCWDANTRDINKCKKLKFQKTIADLININDDTLVLYSDGTFAALQDAIQSRKDEINPSISPHLNVATEIMSDAKVFTLTDGRFVLTYFERLKNGDIDMIWQPLDSSSAMRFVLKRDNMRVAGYAVIEGDDAPMLLTIWSDKRIFLLSLNDSVMPEKSPGNFVSMISILKVDNPLSVLGISRNFVAIYGANAGQEGASLLLYNTQFKVIKAKQFFKVYFDFSRLWALDENILLAMGQNLSVVSYRMSKDVLAELVGSQTNNDFTKPIEGDNINEEEPLQESLQFLNKISITNTSAQMFTDAKSGEYADGKLIPYDSIHNFDRSLNTINKLHMHVDAVEIERDFEDIQINLMTNYNDEECFSREVELIARQLERCGASEHEITEKLLNVLIKADLLQDISVCLKRYSNVSEKILAKVLNYILSKFMENSNSKLSTESQLEMDVVDTVKTITNESIPSALPNMDILSNKFQCVNPINASSVLNLVLACSFDEFTLATYIRQEIDYTKVITLLEYLYNLLNSSEEEEIFEDSPDFTPHCIKSEMKILRWFGVVINSHFQKLALSKDPHLMDILYKWHQLFSLYKREVAELEKLSAVLYNIVQHKKLSKEKNFSKWYSIEELTLY